MKLSEAIRLGAMIRPQGSGSFFYQGHSCALGAAYEATFDTTEFCGIPTEIGRGLGGILKDAYPILSTLVQHPFNPEEDRRYVGSFIVYLNDEKKWTREQIADWVESVEREIEAKQQQSAVETVTA